MAINFVTIIINASTNVHVCIIAGEDYSGSPITVTVPAGVTMQPFTINIIDNNIIECDETFNIAMIPVTICGVTIGNNDNGEVIIRDYDGKYKFLMIISVMSENVIWSTGATVSLTRSQYFVLESGNIFQGVIRISRTTSEDVTVEVTVSDGSANGNVE